MWIQFGDKNTQHNPFFLTLQLYPNCKLSHHQKSKTTTEKQNKRFWRYILPYITLSSIFLNRPTLSKFNTPSLYNSYIFHSLYQTVSNRL